PAPAALVDWGAHEPVHHAVDRGDAWRRPAELPRRAARQRTYGRARRRGGKADARVYPLQRLPQRLPGLRPCRRPCIRLGLPGPDRRDPDAPAPRRGGGFDAALRINPLRCLLRGLPGHDRHPPRAGSSTRARGGASNVSRRVGAPVSAAREEILRRIRDALADVPQDEAPDDVDVPREYEAHDPEATVARFVERLRDYGTVVHEVAADGVSHAVGDACRGRGVARVVVPADLPEAWRPD